MTLLRRVHRTNTTGKLVDARFVEEFWLTPVSVKEQRYFDGMLYLMSMLHCSGNFHIWGPAEPAR